jgi:16S rRNA processing protein RimM
MRRIELGNIGKPSGMDGGLKFRGEPAILELDRVYLDGLGYRAIEDVRVQNDELVLYLVGVDTREAAEKLVGLKVLADEGEMPELEEGYFYLYQLVGLKVLVGGQLFGEVSGVQDVAAQDLLEIRDSTGKTHLVPLQAPYVRVEGDGVYIEPIPGLFE